MATIRFAFDPNAKPNEGGRGDYTPTPEGVHHIKVVSMEQQPPGPGKEWGSIAVKYEVVKSEDATAIGRSRTFWLQLSPKATPYFLIPFLQACGIALTTGQQMTAQGPIPTVDCDIEHAVGAIVVAKCKHDVGNNGKTREDWSDFAVSDINPLLAGAPSSPAMQPAPQNIPQAVQGYAQQPAPGFQSQPVPQGYPMQQPAPQYAQQPAPQGQMPPRRFG